MLTVLPALTHITCKQLQSGYTSFIPNASVYSTFDNLHTSIHLLLSEESTQAPADDARRHASNTCQGALLFLGPGPAPNTRQGALLFLGPCP